MAVRFDHRWCRWGRAFAPVLALSLVSGLAAQEQAAQEEQVDQRQADQERKIARAREVLALFLDGKYEQFVARGNDQLQATFSPEKARQAAEQIFAVSGAFQSEKSAEYTRTGKLDSVLFSLTCERATLRLQVVLDDQGRLAGFWARGVESNEVYKPPAYVDRAAFRDETVTIKTGEFELPGTLSVPVTRVEHPAVVLVHGSGPHDQDETVLANKPFRDLAWGLASRGVAVLRYEKRTHKYAAQMDPEQVTLETEAIADAASAVKLLSKRGEIDPRRVYVLGHSLGAMAAPYVAQREPRPAGIILMAASARSILDLIEEQIEYIARSDGRLSEEERSELAALRRATAAIRAGRLEDVEQPPLGAPAVYWRRLHELDPVTETARLEMPVLIIHGGRDYQVSAEDLKIWQERIGDRDNVTIRLYERLNHLMVAGNGPSTPGEYRQVGHVDEQVIRDVAAWIQSGGKLP